MSERHLQQLRRKAIDGDLEAEREFFQAMCRTGQHDWQQYDSSSWLGPEPQDDETPNPNFHCTLWEIRRCGNCKLWDHRPLPQHPDVSLDQLWPHSLMVQAYAHMRGGGVRAVPIDPDEVVVTYAQALGGRQFPTEEAERQTLEHEQRLREAQMSTNVLLSPMSEAIARALLTGAAPDVPRLQAGD